MDTDTSQIVHQEILSRLMPPSTADLVDRIHFHTHIGRSYIQTVLWQLFAAKTVVLDDHLHLHLAETSLP